MPHKLCALTSQLLYITPHSVKISHPCGSLRVRCQSNGGGGAKNRAKMFARQRWSNFTVRCLADFDKSLSLQFVSLPPTHPQTQRVSNRQIIHAHFKLGIRPHVISVQTCLLWIHIKKAPPLFFCWLSFRKICLVLSQITVIPLLMAKQPANNEKDFCNDFLCNNCLLLVLNRVISLFQSQISLCKSGKTVGLVGYNLWL